MSHHRTKTAAGRLHGLLAVCLALSSACATSRELGAGSSKVSPEPKTVRVTKLAGARLRLDFEPISRAPEWEVLREEEVRAVLAEFLRCVEEPSKLPVVPVLASSLGVPAPWEARLRTEFLARYGPSRLPLPDSLQHSRLFLAFRLSTRFMGAGVRDAAQALFRSPVFLASVTLAVVVYFAAWLNPEPLFTKAFAAALTARLALAVGLLELRNVALALLQFYQEVHAARTMAELEAIAERFGRSLGGTALRVLVMVASFGVAKGLPNVPPGGLGPLLSPPRFAVPGGVTLQASATAHAVADGSIVLAGAAVGTAGSAAGSACGEGSSKEGYQWHHLATNKNSASAGAGGPWTPLFQSLFDRAEMGLNAEENLVHLKGHQGPHPEAYHEAVYSRLDSAMEGCRTVSQCRTKLVKALKQLAEQVCTPGTALHRLATRSKI